MEAESALVKVKAGGATSAEVVSQYITCKMLGLYFQQNLTLSIAFSIKIEAESLTLPLL